MQKIRLTRFSIFCSVTILLLLAAFLVGCRHDGGRAGRDGDRQAPGAGGDQVLCPLDGVPADNAQLATRPLAVMIENSPRARPQSGLLDACVVYEAITEGGITRFLAIYQHGSPSMIGPVRSARPHFINLQREYDAVYVHCGQSYEALQMLATDSSITHLDEMLHGTPFWRDRERRAPHNLYTSAEKLRAYVRKQGWESTPEQPIKFWTAGRMPDTTLAADTMRIRFPGAGSYDLRFVYDAKRGGYLRYMDGKLHVDRESGKPIVAHNVIVQRVAAEKFMSSDAGTFDVRVLGSGEGKFFSAGRTMPLLWNKYSSRAATQFTDLQGKTLPFQRGQTWVEIVPVDGTVTVSAADATSR